MTDEYESLAENLEPLESDLLRRAAQADEAGATMLARLLETWAHSVAMARADLSNGDRPGTLPNYLASHEDYDAPAIATESDGDGEGEPRTDGGREFAAQPETCPECGLTLDSNGECPTEGCPGPTD